MRNLGAYLAPNNLPWLSPSQVELFDSSREGCERKWVIRYLKKVKHQNHSAALGARVHEISEAFLKFGTRPDLGEKMVLPDKYTADGTYTYYPGQIFQAGMHLLEPAIGKAKIEGGFRFSSNVSPGEPLYWQGAKDLEWDDTVGDLKTSKNPKAYGKTGCALTPGWEQDEKDRKARDKPGRLLADTQFNLYAHEIQERLNLVRSNGLWIYLPTKPSAKVPPYAVKVVAERQTVLEQVARIETVGRRVLQMYRDKPEPQDVAPNTDMCDGFGGCPYKGTEHCKLTISSYFGGETMGSREEFQAAMTRLTGGGAPPPPPPPPPPPLQMMPLGQVTQLSPAVSPPPPPPAPVADTDAALASVLDAETTELVRQYMIRDCKKDPAVVNAIVDAGGTNLAARPEVESGTINPPEAAGLVPLATPEELAAVNAIGTTPDRYDSMSREQLKELGIKRGIWTQSVRYAEPRMRSELRSFDVKGAPVTVPEGVQEAFEETMSAVLAAEQSEDLEVVIAKITAPPTLADVLAQVSTALSMLSQIIRNQEAAK